MRINYLCLAAVVSVLLITAFPGTPGITNASGTVDHSIYDKLLRIYVQDGMVSYKGFKNEEAELDRYLALLAEVETDTLERQEQFAFYINAYNAWTIKLILSEYPGIESIWDLGNIIQTPWKKKICRLNGKTVSLDHIEHDILRPVFKDPRVHFAINCASKGCPPLREEAYVAHRLDQQLDEATRLFINNPAFNRLEGRRLYVSKIFKWFDEDFNKDIVGFVATHAEGALKRGLKTHGDQIKIKYLDYDWALNGR